MVSNLLKTYTPDSIRLYLAKHYYRTPWEFTYADLDQSLSLCTELAHAVHARSGDGHPMDYGHSRTAFENAMDNDLDSPSAAGVLCELGAAILEHADARRDVRAAQEWLRRGASILGMRLDAYGPEAHVRSGWDQHLNRFLT
jgi:cysteinyl-tRNA synthetase